VASPYKIRLRFDRETFRDYFSFSWPLLIASGSALVIGQAAILTGRWHLGLAATGVIALSTSITSFSERVDDLVTDTLYPAICAVKDRAALLYESFVKSNRLALMWAVPFGIALTLFAADLVHYGIGDRWRPAIGVLQVYGVIAAVNHVGFNWQAYLQAQGNTRPIAVANVGSAIVYLAVGVPLILLLGLRGFAYSMAVLTASLLAFRAYYLRRVFDGFSFLAHCGRAFAPTVPALAVIVLARALEPSGRSPGIAAAELAAYVTVTLAATWYFESHLLREVLGYLTARRAPDPEVTTASAA
jgi:O-antigen/teichoic acid export membrane protein